MTNPDSLFSSRARFRVLRTLYYQNKPLPLRQVASISQMPVYSIQRALKQMVEEGLLIRKKKKHYRLFLLNKAHDHYPFLAQLFDLERRHSLSLFSNRFHQKARNLLDFVDQANRLFAKVKT